MSCANKEKILKALRDPENQKTMIDSGTHTAQSIEEMISRIEKWDQVKFVTVEVEEETKEPTQ